jgi:tetratricopeptide (TPR) repeat protein
VTGRLRPLGVLALVALLWACNADERQMLAQAEGRWRDGNYEDSIRLNMLLYQREPQGRYAARALLNIGNIYYLNLRQMKDAIEAYRRLVDELAGRPEEMMARQQLARIYANEVGDLTQAIIQYDRLLEMNDLDNRIEIQYQRANAYFRQQDYSRALRELLRIEEAGISGHLAHQVYLKIGNIYQIQRKYADAAACFLKVAEAPCQECRRQAILELAETYESLYDIHAAIESIHKLDRSPENDRFIAREEERLREKSRRMDSGPPADFFLPHR